jgi:hypothetical protein
MALPWDSSTGAYVPGSATSGLANPVQNPLQSMQDQATLDAMAKHREKLAVLERALMRAAALKEEPLNAQGAGPFGSRQGVGPAGWATTLGDVVAGVIAQKRREGKVKDVTGAQTEVTPAIQDYVKNFLNGAPGGMYGTGYGSSNQSYVPQGSPLSLGSY